MAKKNDENFSCHQFLKNLPARDAIASKNFFYKKFSIDSRNLTQDAKIQNGKFAKFAVYHPLQFYVVFAFNKLIVFKMFSTVVIYKYTKTHSHSLTQSQFNFTQGKIIIQVIRV